MIAALRSVLDEENLNNPPPVVVGVGARSTRDTIQLTQDAAASGADFVLVVAPAYYASVLKSNSIALRQYFTDVADASPIPL